MAYQFSVGVLYPYTLQYHPDLAIAREAEAGRLEILEDSSLPVGQVEVQSKTVVVVHPRTAQLLRGNRA